MRDALYRMAFYSVVNVSIAFDICATALKKMRGSE